MSEQGTRMSYDDALRQLAFVSEGSQGDTSYRWTASGRQIYFVQGIDFKARAPGPESLFSKGAYHGQTTARREA